MKLYDLLVEGYHTPLTADQIAELFRAGRLQRHDPCKEKEKAAWRTIEDLFPLLKYDSAAGIPMRHAGAAIRDGGNINRRALLIGIFITLLAISAFFIGATYFRVSHEPVRSESGVRVDADTISQSSTPSPPATPRFTSTASYSNEQYETARRRQEERARQLEQTRVAEQRIISERLQTQPPSQLNKSAKADLTVPLGTYTSLNVGGRRYRLAVHDDGPDEIRVIIDYAPPVRFQKHGGFEEREVETLILSNGDAHLYYVNTISDHIGHCTLRVRDE